MNESEKDKKLNPKKFYIDLFTIWSDFLSEFNLFDMATNLYQQGIRERGRFNIIIAGRSGVGKSTLINAMFQEDLATTGQGRPITKDIEEYTKDGMPISIFDTRGLEMADYAVTVDEVVNLVTTRAREADDAKHIHLAWVCISEDSRRVEKGEEELVEKLSQCGVPVVVVITKKRSNNGFDAEVGKILKSAKEVVRVRAIGETDDDGNTSKPHGLDNLLSATDRHVAEGVKNALSASQKVSLQFKINRCKKIINSASVAGGGSAAISAGGAETALIALAQFMMIVSIALTFGLKASPTHPATILSTVLGSNLLVYTAKTFAARLLKMVPVIGSAGAVVDAAVTAAITQTVGNVYLGTLKILFEKHNAVPDEKAVVKKFLDEWKAFKK